MAAKTQVGLAVAPQTWSPASPNGNGHRRPQVRPIRILHIVNDLAIGGSEMMLYKLLSRTNRKRFEPIVISLDGIEKLGPDIRQLGIPVHAMGMKPSLLGPLSLLR